MRIGPLDVQRCGTPAQRPLRPRDGPNRRDRATASDPPKTTNRPSFVSCPPIAAKFQPWSVARCLQIDGLRADDFERPLHDRQSDLLKQLGLAHLRASDLVDLRQPSLYLSVARCVGCRPLYLSHLRNLTLATCLLQHHLQPDRLEHRRQERYVVPSSDTRTADNQDGLTDGRSHLQSTTTGR